jgi:hypothetical protein
VTDETSEKVVMYGCFTLVGLGVLTLLGGVWFGLYILYRAVVG